LKEKKTTFGSPAMKRLFPAHALACAAALLSGVDARAGRPMVVDDAVIVDRDSCQVESWSQRIPDQTEYWAMPACRVGAWELGAGLGRIGPGATAAYRSHMLQAKTIFRPLTAGGWGIGLTIADQYRQGSGLAGDLSVLVPLSVSLLENRVLAHVNAGWLHRHGGRDGATWAFGAELAVKAPLTLTLESYGAGHGGNYVQAGLRLDAIPGRLALDAGAGRRLGRGGAEHYFTFGLTLVGRVFR
jgi:hypothetical protein